MAVTIKLQRYREHYGWTVEVSGEDDDDALARLESLNSRLERIYGAGTPDAGPRH